MSTKLALLLALAIGAFALCAATEVPTSKTFNCPRGNAYDGNNRPDKFPACKVDAVLCKADNCRDNAPCMATCSDGTKLMLTLLSTGEVIVRNQDGQKVRPENGFYKGCNAYCAMRAWVPAYVPQRNGGGSCGLSHADFCYIPPVKH